MDTNIGQVVEVQAENVLVKMTRTSACSRCGACKSWNADSSGQEILVTAKNKCGAVPSNYVRVELEHGVFLKAVLTLYCFPLAALVAGFALGDTVGRMLSLGQYSSLLGFVLGLAFVVCAYFGIKRFGTKANHAAAVEIVMSVGELDDKISIN